MLEWRGRLREPTATQPWEASDDWAQSVTLPVVARCIGGLHPAGARTVTRPRTGPRQGPSQGPLRDPLRDPSGGPGRPGEKIPDFRPPGPPGPGAPRGAPRGPPGTPPGPPGWGPIYMSFVHLGGSPGGPPGGPPGGVPPGGPKSAHFFGYLITLPVGTKIGIFSTFFRGPKWAKMGVPGGDRGGACWDSAYDTACNALCLGWRPRGGQLRRAPRAALRAWGVRSARMASSLKARDGSPAQGCRRCESDEAVCESQTRPEERSAARGPP